MREEHVRWHSPTIGRDFEMLVFGHAGIPVIAYPTSMGRHYQNRDFGLIGAASWFVDNGLVKIYCPDSLDNEGWYNTQIHPADRIRVHQHYDHLIRHELVPRAQYETGHDRVAVAGASFGAYHATNFALRYPGLVRQLINMGGAYDIKMQLDGYYDDSAYYNNPTDFLSGIQDPMLWQMGIILGVGEHDFCRAANERLSQQLSDKGVQHWLDVKPGGVHDWPVWCQMFPEYLSRLNF
ncbi:MAG: esterase family protein [Hymenobacteraceae bacterium]|nr:esterase family protein [Hymenobacteraceae bacterium]